MSVGLSARQRGSRRELRRRYWFPCAGYWSSRSRDWLPPNVITGASTADSVNCLVSSQDGNVFPRRGIAYYGETDPTAQVGLLEAVTKNLSMNMMCRHMLDVQYPSTTPGTISGPTALYTDALDTGHFGQILALTSTQGTRKVLGHEMGTLASPGTTHYPRSVDLTKPNFRMVPIPYLAGGSGTQATGYNRCAFPLHRALLAGGSMKMVHAGDELLWGSLHGTPGKWDRKSNPSTSTGSEVVHIAPWGNRPPLFAPIVSAANASTGTNDQVWWDGDQFYMSIVFRYKDGSFSAPFQPHQSSTLAAPNGLVTVGSTSGTAAYRSLSLIGIAIGGRDVAARLLCRTRKTNVSTATTRPTAMTPAGATSDIDAAGRKLYVFAVINNNTQTTYTMTESNDDFSLVDNATALSPFHIWPLPARHAFDMERRVGLGYTRRANPCAIILAPTRAASPGSTRFNLNVPEDANPAIQSPYGGYALCWRITVDTSGVAVLWCRAASIGSSAISGFSIVLGGTQTIQDVIDGINNDVLSSTDLGYGEWAAQPAPGTETNILSDYLAPTSVNLALCILSASPTVTKSANLAFADIAVGMRVRLVSGTGSVPARTVVIGKASDNSLTIGDENGNPVNATAGTATLEFWSDTGDDDWSTDTATWGVGNVRSFCGAWPAVIALKGSYIDSLGIDKQGLLITSASPGNAQLAPQAFFNLPANRMSAPLDAGIFMGAAPVFPNAVACYSDWIYVLRNVRNTNTGEDQDYHLYPFSPKGRGCIQSGTIVSGSGWAGYLTRDGYVVTDGNTEVPISDALLDPAHGGRGILAYPCVTLSSTNGVADLPQHQTAFAYVHDGTLRLSFEPNAAIA